MKYIFIIVLTILSLFANNEFYNNCQKCHGHSHGKSPLVMSMIQQDFMDHEFITYLEYNKDKFSIHSSIIQSDDYSQKIKDEIIKASSLPYQTRVEITDFIFSEQDDSNACMW